MEELKTDEGKIYYVPKTHEEYEVLIGKYIGVRFVETQKLEKLAKIPEGAKLLELNHPLRLIVFSGEFRTFSNQVEYEFLRRSKPNTRMEILRVPENRIYLHEDSIIISKSRAFILSPVSIFSDMDNLLGPSWWTSKPPSLVRNDNYRERVRLLEEAESEGVV